MDWNLTNVAVDVELFRNRMHQTPAPAPHSTLCDVSGQQEISRWRKSGTTRSAEGLGLARFMPENSGDLTNHMIINASSKMWTTNMNTPDAKGKSSRENVTHIIT